MQPGDGGYREVLDLRDCKSSMARSRDGREALRALLRERIAERGGGEWGCVTMFHVYSPQYEVVGTDHDIMLKIGFKIKSVRSIWVMKTEKDRYGFF